VTVEGHRLNTVSSFPAVQLATNLLTTEATTKNCRQYNTVPVVCCMLIELNIQSNNTSKKHLPGNKFCFLFIYFTIVSRKFVGFRWCFFLPCSTYFHRAQTVTSQLSLLLVLVHHQARAVEWLLERLSRML
jgi:hypothetical protein